MTGSISHFSHPPHKLVRKEHTFPIGCKCDMCLTSLTGVRYSCHACNFDIHESCSQYPMTLSFFAHPWHALTLLRPGEARRCDLCHEEIPGDCFIYRCVQCGFDLHPQCSKLQQTVQSTLHAAHSLTMVTSSGECAACHDTCNLWFYRCGPCKVNLHIECLDGAHHSGRSEHKHHSSEHTTVKSMGKFVGKTIVESVVENVINQDISNLFSS